MTRSSEPAGIGAPAVLADCARECVTSALRVLVAWNEGCAPEASDLQRLRATFPSSAHIPHDELASHVIHALSPLAFPRARVCSRLEPQARELAYFQPE